MGQLDNAPSKPNDEGKAAREALRKVSQDLRALRDEFSGQLNQDITRLQGTKHRLLNDIEILEEEYQSLRGNVDALKEQQTAELSRQQLAQQQLWAKKLAQALATHLQGRLTQDIYSGASLGGATAADGSLQNAYQLLSSLDASLNDTLHSLQQDLNSYQSSLSQQISRMHSMEQQGEAILEALVSRLSLQLQTQVARPQSVAAIANGNGVSNGQSLYSHRQVPLNPSAGNNLPGSTSLPYHQAPAPTQTPTGGVAAKAKVGRSEPAAAKTNSPASAFQTGLLLIVLSTLALSFHNVMVGLIGYGGDVFGRLPIQGIFPLNIPNSLMLLWIRMVVVLPLIAIVAGKIYPKVWADIRRFLGQQDKRPLLPVVASGGFLFMSQVLIYKAISDIGPGVAVTLLFMYPLIAVPLAWFLFGDRPSPLRGLVMFTITIGIVFTALPRINADLSNFSVGAVSPWGVVAGLLSSAAFAMYLVSMQISFRKLHPVPVTLVQFTTIFVLTSLILIGGSFFGLETGEPSSYPKLYLAGILLGVLTLLGYLFNNFGVRLMGAAQASIVASSGPVLTAILAYLITPGPKSALQFIQWIGVILVTLGVLALSLERLGKKPKAPKKVKA
ncbi:MAG: EamA family transporter [Cyanobacteria bacterium P01_C01_bin.70]